MSERIICDRCIAPAHYGVFNHGFFEVACRVHLSMAVDASMFDGGDDGVNKITTVRPIEAGDRS